MHEWMPEFRELMPDLTPSSLSLPFCVASSVSDTGSAILPLVTGEMLQWLLGDAGMDAGIDARIHGIGAGIGAGNQGIDAGIGARKSCD